ncbi:MAG: winged helix-turn-helix domain-containing protein [Microbacterium gubbeenense]
MLDALAAAGGSVVPRAALLGALPGSRQSTHAVEMAIARLREALGHPDLVATVVKRGYRLTVSEES